MNPVDPAKAYRLMYPAVPAIVACNDNGLVYAMPAVSMMSLSNNPALVGVASSPDHSTSAAIAKVKSFSVSWLDASKAEAVRVLGTTGHSGMDKLKAAGLGHSRGRQLDVPVPEDAVAALECSLYARQILGDHYLFVGKVLEARASDDFQEYWRFERYAPILYTGIQQGNLTTYRP